MGKTGRQAPLPNSFSSPVDKERPWLFKFRPNFFTTYVKEIKYKQTSSQQVCKVCRACGAAFFHYDGYDERQEAGPPPPTHTVSFGLTLLLVDFLDYVPPHPGGPLNKLGHGKGRKWPHPLPRDLRKLERRDKKHSLSLNKKLRIDRYIFSLKPVLRSLEVMKDQNL